MITTELCGPALIYLTFSLTQVVIDSIKGYYNTALFKFIIMLLVTILLNTLCVRGLSAAAWVIVFIPFVTMTVITALLLYFFGLDPKQGSINVVSSNQVKKPRFDPNKIPDRHAISHSVVHATSKDLGQNLHNTSDVTSDVSSHNVDHMPNAPAPHNSGNDISASNGKASKGGNALAANAVNLDNDMENPAE